jgi:hypothetical protein
MNQQNVYSPMLLRLTLVTGIIFIVIGVLLLFSSGEILATFILDLVVGTISKEALTDLPPYEYSWGIKHWGLMNEELVRAAVGLLVLAAGQMLLLPPLVMKSKGLGRAGVIVSMVVIGFSAILFVFVPISIKQAFGMIASTGAVDPVALGDMIHVNMNFLSKIAMLIAESIIVLSALRILFSRNIQCSPMRFSGKLAITFLSTLFFLLFALPFLSLAFGPLTRVIGNPAIDPVEFAGYMRSAIDWMILSAAMLSISALLGLIGAIMPNS